MNQPEYIATAMLDAEDFDPKDWVMQNIKRTPRHYGELRVGDLLYDRLSRTGEEVMQVNPSRSVHVCVYRGNGAIHTWVHRDPTNEVAPSRVVATRPEIGAISREHVERYFQRLRQRSITEALLLEDGEDIDPKEWVMRSMPDMFKGPHIRITFLDGAEETVYIKCYWDKMAYFRGSSEQPGVIPDPTDEQKRAFSYVGSTQSGDSATESLHSARYEGDEREGTIDRSAWDDPGGEQDEFDFRPFHFQYFNDEDVPWNKLYPQEGDIVEARRRVKLPAPEPEEIDPKDWVMQKMPTAEPEAYIRVTFLDGDRETIKVKGDPAFDVWFHKNEPMPGIYPAPTPEQLAQIGGARGGADGGSWAIDHMHGNRYEWGSIKGELGNDPEEDDPYRPFRYEYVGEKEHFGKDWIDPWANRYL